MPLVATPNRGYADWQRVSNWDSGTLYSTPGGVNITTDQTPILDVSRYAYLAGWDQISGIPVQVDIYWYGDKAQTVSFGHRLFVLDPNNQGVAQYRIPNLGPYVQIVWTRIGPGSFQHPCSIMATNRFHPLEFIPVLPTLIDLQGLTLPAGSSFYYPGGYYAGPLQVFANSFPANSFLAMQVLNSAGGWDTMLSMGGLAANAAFQWIAPAGGWRLAALAVAASTPNTILVAVPTLTGST